MVEDAQLFKEAQSGSTAAFGQLIRRHEALVGAVAIARMRQTAQVEDVVQETFVTAWVRRETLREPEKFRAWVCAIARNQAAKLHRRESRSLEQVEPDAARNAEDQLMRAETERALNAALESLPEDHREVLVLFYREEQSIRDIASALSLSEAAAQKRISRARESVKEGMRALLGDALPTTKTAAGVSAVVLAAIATGLSATAASASTISSASPSSTVTQGSYIMKIAATLTTLAAVAGGAAIYSYASDRGNAAAKGATPQAEATANTPVTVPRAVESSQTANDAGEATAITMRRVDRKERARRFAKHESSSQSQAGAAPNNTPSQSPPALPSAMSDKDIIRSTIASVKPLIAECHELAQLSDPTLEGMVGVRFYISDELDIAGLVTEAEISIRKGGFVPPNLDFEQCLQETMLSLEFEGMSRDIAVTYPFVFRLPGESQASQLSTAKLSETIEKSSDTEQLMELAAWFGKTEPTLSMRACEKAVDLEPTLAHAFTCTMHACRASQSSEALAFWSATSEFSFGQSLEDRAVEVCSANDIDLP